MNNQESENLLSDTPAIFVNQIGYIGQYLSYYDEYWLRGTPYFIRDLYVKTLSLYPDNEEFKARVDRINSKIWEYESWMRQQSEGSQESDGQTTRRTTPASPPRANLSDPGVKQQSESQRQATASHH